MAEEKILTSQLIYEGRAVKLRVDTVQVASGRETTREIVEHSDCVAIVAIDADDNILLVHQFREPVEKGLLEIPAGGIDPGEDPVTSVCRELREETGYMPGQVERLEEHTDTFTLKVEGETAISFKNLKQPYSDTLPKLLLEAFGDPAKSKGIKAGFAMYENSVKLTEKKLKDELEATEGTLKETENKLTEALSVIKYLEKKAGLSSAEK